MVKDTINKILVGKNFNEYNSTKVQNDIVCDTHYILYHKTLYYTIKIYLESTIKILQK